MSLERLKTEGEEAYTAGRYGQASELFESALKQAEAQPKIVVNCLLGLAQCQIKLDCYSEAERVLAAAQERAVAEDWCRSEEYARILSFRGFTLAALERYSEADELLQTALKLQKELCGPDSMQTAECLSNLGCALVREGKSKEAEPWLSQALGIINKLGAADSQQYGETLTNLGLSYLLQGNLTLAEVMLKQAVRVEELRGSKKHPNLAQALQGLATVKLQKLRKKEAVVAAASAVNIFESTLPSKHPAHLAALNILASAQLGGGDLLDASKNFEKVLKLAGAEPEKNQAVLFTSCLGLGLCLSSQKKLAAAEQQFERARKLLSEVQKDHAESKLLESLFSCYLLQGKFAAAANVMPDRWRIGNESNLKSYVNLLNILTELGERHAWKRDDDGT